MAHGTRDAAGAEVVRRLVARVRAMRPGTPVELGWLGLVDPSVAEVLAAVSGPVVTVPLLLGGGNHLRIDVPRLLAAAGRGGGPAPRALGPATALAQALAGRLAQAGRPAGPTPVVLASAGSREPRAHADVAATARLLARRLDAPVVPAFLSGGTPTPQAAVAALRGRGHDRVAVASYLLAPGHFASRLAAAGGDWTAAPLGPSPAVAGLVWRRYDQARAATRPAAGPPAAVATAGR
ncbi:sirohydrochlorin chelatase [Streptomyces sp. NPDC059740]|uniref:sirohydrochlorin chelatase n=1 Tax=Streptomyces sp. NPDC059740 TaxID=3346926 RepID=UPI0036677B3A